LADSPPLGDRRPEGALRAVDVFRSYAGVQALGGVTLELRRGEIVGLIGPNGAGKTTLVNVLSGADRPTSGRIELDGVDVTGWPPPKRACAGLARTFQHGHTFHALSVRENVEVAALGVGVRAAEARQRASELLELLELSDRADQPAGTLPHGEEHKLGVARALAMRPLYVLMDEPAAGLPDAEVPAFALAMRMVRDEHGAGVLVIDHNMALIMEVCERIYVLDGGRTLAQGTPAQIRENIDVVSAYLGGGGVAVEEAHA
jgi:branched-chain amino acid transport system ATP-binding protein